MDQPPPRSLGSAHTQIERISEPWALNRMVAVGVTLVLAMLFGSWVASGQFSNVVLVGVWFAAAMIIIFVQDQWWSPALVITAISIETSALGFPMSGLEIGMIILAITFPVKMAMKTLRKAEPVMDAGILYWLLLAYVCVHAVIILGYNHLDGVPLKNIVKAYYAAITPLIFYGLLIRYCYTYTVKPAAIAIYTATFIAVFFSIITVVKGIDFQPFSDLKISIDWLSYGGATGVLRNSPVYLFIGSLAFWPATHSPRARFILAMGVCFGLLGVLLGGGRLSLASCILGAASFAFIRKRIWVALPAIVLTALISVLITAKPDVLNSLPGMFQRALTPLNFSDQQTDVEQGLEGSDDWHRDLRNRSIDYWTQDTKSFWLGHGFKPWDPSLDSEIEAGNFDYEANLQIAIEMGRTENMFSAITNIFGLTGLLLYAAFLIDLAWRLWKAARVSPFGTPARAICEFSLTVLLIAFALSLLGGGPPNITLIYWQLGILAARPYIMAKAAGKKVEPEEDALPAFIPKGLRAMR